jgi:ATP-dependent RNA helicase RhlE
MKFRELDLIEPLLRAIRAEGYSSPTPIQELAIPPILDGRDLQGCAQTGTGKTAAFALPILQRLSARRWRGGGSCPIRTLVLAPTRELALQIGDSFASYGRHLDLKHTVIFGGVGQEPQVRALRRGADIVIATPGRLLDLCSQGFVHFEGLEVFVLDEADRMLDMGFIQDVRRIIAKLPRRRQTLLFSATMPEAVLDLSQKILSDPVYVEATPSATMPERIEHAVYFVEKGDKRELLSHLLNDPSIRRALVFTRTKHGADRVAKHLSRGPHRAEVIHGNKTQGKRERALDQFRRGVTRVLVATDIAARGLDVEGLTHVINFDLPNPAESYVHRIGRTGRAESAGVALSFCGVEERLYLQDIERLIRKRIPVVADHPYRSRLSPPDAKSAVRPAAGRRWSAGTSRRPGSFGRIRVRFG